MSMSDVSWLLEGNLNSKKDYFEMMSYATKVAIASIVQGKDLKLFEEEKANNSVEELTHETRREELDYLSNRFGEL